MKLAVVVRVSTRVDESQFGNAINEESWRLLGICDVGSEDDCFSQVYVSDLFLRFIGVQKEHHTDAFTHGAWAIDLDGVDERDKSPTKSLACCDGWELGVEVSSESEVDGGDVLGRDVVGGDHLVEEFLGGVHDLVASVFRDGGGASDAAYCCHDFLSRWIELRLFRSDFTVDCGLR